MAPIFRSPYCHLFFWHDIKWRTRSSIVHTLRTTTSFVFVSCTERRIAADIIIVNNIEKKKKKNFNAEHSTAASNVEKKNNIYSERKKANE